MERGYEVGTVVGVFEVLEKTGSCLETNGSRQGVYRVRCLVCGDDCVLLGRQLRDKKDCGCRKVKKRLAEWRRGRRSLRGRRTEVWMDEGEIYRAWKASRDRQVAYSVLAQLNDVPVKVIVDIIKKKEAEDLYLTTRSDDI